MRIIVTKRGHLSYPIKKGAVGLSPYMKNGLAFFLKYGIKVFFEEIKNAKGLRNLWERSRVWTKR